MSDIKESDWKTFNKIKDLAIETFCENAFSEYREIMENESEHIHNRYLHHYKLVQNRNKQMALFFDGHSRSKASLQLLAIRGEGLANKELLSQLSEEFLKNTDPESKGW
ncbi:hypothetical protein OAP18_01290 [Gammaproteobacteria bacterium]|nr:hypothetical protein [Gammaproteobacteria bacterium]